MTTAGGPGGSSEPGWVSVGLSSTGNASVTYLGNRWVLTASHVSISTTVSFGGTSYDVEGGTTTFLHNPDTSTAELKMFRVTTEPGLPVITPSLLSSTTPAGRQIMIGNGLSTVGSQQFWHDDGTTDPWPSDTTPGTVDPDDYSGFDLDSSHQIRWGENTVVATGLLSNTFAYTTVLDDADYTGTVPLAGEAQASTGDSGGAVFQFDGSVWKLAGIMLAISGLRQRQPSSTAVFGDTTYIADLSVYRNEILSLVPEPDSGPLALVATVVLGVVAVVRRRGREDRTREQ